MAWGSLIGQEKYLLNTALINTYKHVQSNANELYNEIETLITEYSEIIGDEINRKSTTIEEASTSQESYYYWIRYRYNNLNSFHIFNKIWVLVAIPLIKMLPLSAKFQGEE